MSRHEIEVAPVALSAVWWSAVFDPASVITHQFEGLRVIAALIVSGIAFTMILLWLHPIWRASVRQHADDTMNACTAIGLCGLAGLLYGPRLGLRVDAPDVRLVRLGQAKRCMGAQWGVGHGAGRGRRVTVALGVITLLWSASAAKAQVPTPTIDFGQPPTEWGGSGVGTWSRSTRYQETGRIGYLAARPGGDNSVFQQPEMIVSEAGLWVEHSADHYLEGFGNRVTSGASCEAMDDGTPVIPLAKVYDGEFHGYPATAVTFTCRYPSYAWRAVDQNYDSWSGSATSWHRITCFETTPGGPCATVWEAIEAHVSAPAALGENVERPVVDALVDEMDAWKARWTISMPGGRAGGVDLPAPAVTSTQPVPEPTLARKPISVNWQVIIGGIGAVAVAAAGLASRARRKPPTQEKEEQKEPETAGYVLQLSHNRLALRAGKPAQLLVAVWRVDSMGQYTLAADARISLITPRGVAVLPAEGLGRVACRIEQQNPDIDGDQRLTIEAQAGGESYASEVTLTLEAEYQVEFF